MLITTHKHLQSKFYRLDFGIRFVETSISCICSLDVERTKNRSHWTTVVSDYYTPSTVAPIMQRFASEHQRQKERAEEPASCNGAHALGV
jgi:5,10-methylene-tetrahydrofolate dehydrogenase/methenyl tetrahydrofolate cyclohydrolase